MNLARNNIFVNATFVILLGCWIPSAFGAGAEEECLTFNLKRGVCRTRSNCSSSPSTGRESETVICHYQGKIAYICCELPEFESRRYYPGESETFQENSKEEEEEEESNSDVKEYDEDSNARNEEEEEEVEDRFYFGNNGRNRNRWNSQTRKKNHWKLPGARNNNYIRESRREDSNLHFTHEKQPVWGQNQETSNSFYVPNHKGTYNTGYQNHKTQGNTHLIPWNQPNQDRPHFVNNGNGYGGWQENQNYYGNYDNRRTTERPWTPEYAAGVRPNARPDFNRPQNPGLGNRPHTSSFYENRPGNGRPQNFNSGGSRPQNFNSGGNRPQNFNSGGNRPQNFNSGDSRPQNFNSGGSRPQNFNSGGSRPQNFNSGGSRPQNEFPARKRISELKCEKYSESVTMKVSGLPLTLNPQPITINVEKCNSAQQLIVGGEKTTPGEFPHMAAIGYQKEGEIVWKCGGSLISDQYVLTAAHCATQRSGKPVKVRLGEYNLKDDEDGAHPEEYSIADVIKHPDYKPPSKYNDIALLKLSRRVGIKKHIRPACLNVHHEVPEPKVIAIGWGNVRHDEKRSDTLLKVALDVVEVDACGPAFQNSVRKGELSQGIINSQICAGDKSGNKDTCQGDSGGPIEIVSKNNRCVHYIVGVTSFGKVCGIGNTPGVYTRVASYIPWIESIVWPQ